MCSILVTNKPINDLAKVNRFLKSRGPDLTNCIPINGYNFLHNLLSLTGKFAEQPLIDPPSQVACLFNGEIYNYRALGEFSSDGYSIIPAYRRYGLDFPKFFDGEFALVLFDFKNDIMVVATDPFSTKPLWLSIEGKHIGVSTYRSGLDHLGFQDVRKIEANKILAYDLRSLRKIEDARPADFSLEQYKDTYDDWIRAFKKAVAKRAFHSPRQKIFVGLSSGYDSGALACELATQGVDFKAYTVSATEDPDIIAQRHKLLSNGQVIDLTGPEFFRLQKKIVEDCEPYVQQAYSIRKDHASVGLACICERAVQDGRKIHFSGQGADEIISDYGHNGRRFGHHSQMGGLFPDNLKQVFPWRNFQNGSQQMYLAKEEHVAGMYGVEARYPYLDKNLVQEFLSLSSQLKNAKYKSAIDEYLVRNGYPFRENKKIGFQAGKQLS